MTVQTRAGRIAHETLDLRAAAERVPALSTYERSQERRRIIAFLHDHVRLARELLDAGAVERRGNELVAGSLAYDNLAIRHWIELLAAVDVADTARLQALLYGLDALIRVHKWKENELFLAMLESRSGRLSLVG